MKEKIILFLRPIYYFLINICIEPRRVFSLRYYLKYRSQYREFQRLGGIINYKFAILTDYDDQAGIAGGAYFHQDLLVAQFIFEKSPIRHIDIGSRIDGFIAHVASFRQIEVMDVRELKNTGHRNISFFKADLTIEENIQNSITDSISCLHAIEHFGLGRYGDPIDPEGHIKGFNNIIRMLKTNGNLFISFPIGKENQTHFNAHRVFHPSDIFSWPEDKDSLKLERFDYIDSEGNLRLNINIENIKLYINNGCGIYTFKKIK